jgi:hypothetical protein
MLLSFNEKIIIKKPCYKKKFDYFVIDTLSVMVKDSLESSHPVSVEVNDPNEIFSIFDELTYIKVKLYCIFYLFVMTSSFLNQGF